MHFDLSGRSVVFAGPPCVAARAMAGRLRDLGATVTAIPGDLSHPADRGAAVLDLDAVDVLVLDATSQGRLPGDAAEAAAWARALSGLAGLARDLDEDLSETGGGVLVLVSEPGHAAMLPRALPGGTPWLALCLPADGMPRGSTIELMALLCGPVGDGLASGSLLVAAEGEGR